MWKDQEPSEQIIPDRERMDKIGEEVADVAIYLFLLAYELNIDLREVIARKLEKNAVKYPIIEKP